MAARWLEKLSTDAQRGLLAPATLRRSRWLLDTYLVPTLGPRPIHDLQPREVLVALKQIEWRGLRNTPHHALQKCSQLFRYAISIDAAGRDITGDLAGLLERSSTQHHPAIADPRQLGHLLRSMGRFDGNPVVGLALRLTPLVFVRPVELRTAHRPGGRRMAHTSGADEDAPPSPGAALAASPLGCFEKPEQNPRTVCSCSRLRRTQAGRFMPVP